jgi:hypothetical protein
VIPQITEGLLEICKETPRDPIEFLVITYLYRLNFWKLKEIKEENDF